MNKLGDLVTRQLPETPEYQKQGIDGITLIQPVQTSTITMHAVPSNRALHFDFLSCKHFDEKKVLLLLLGCMKTNKFKQYVLKRPSVYDY